MYYTIIFQRFSVLEKELYVNGKNASQEQEYTKKYNQKL